MAFGGLNAELATGAAITIQSFLCGATPFGGFWGRIKA